MDNMSKWLQAYEHKRTSSPALGWTSSRFDLESKDWNSIKEIFIPELEMTFAQACSALKRSWFAYKMSRKQDVGHNSELSWRINRIQYYLGIPLTECETGPSVEWVIEQLSLEEATGEGITAEEMELRHEEDLDRQEQMRSSDLDWGIDHEGEYEPEDPLYAQLRREEKEVEKESDIWNEEYLVLKHLFIFYICVFINNIMT